MREAVSRALILGWYRAGHPGLAQYIQDLGSSFEQQLALATYLRAMIQKEGAQAAISWAEAVPEDDPTYKLAVYRQVASALPLFDHDASMRWCDAHCDGPYGNNLRNIIAGRLLLRDGPGALAWLSPRPTVTRRTSRSGPPSATWGRMDSDAALAWMAEQTAGGEPPAWLEPVYPVYARLLSERSPTEAIEWASGSSGSASASRR